MRYILPLLVFSGLIFLLSLGLRIDPSVIPSALIGKPIPAFTAQSLAQSQQLPLTQQALIGKPAIVSFWATWCPSCLEEHDFLLSLAAEGQFPIYGINYKDEHKLATQWLQEKGNPYALSIYDGDGRVGMEWGVYAVPELFIIDKEGIIRHRFLWPVDKAVLQTVILPLLEPLANDTANS